MAEPFGFFLLLLIDRRSYLAGLFMDRGWVCYVEALLLHDRRPAKRVPPARSQLATHRPLG